MFSEMMWKGYYRWWITGSFKNQQRIRLTEALVKGRARGQRLSTVDETESC